jgi:hypothetical protein
VQKWNKFVEINANALKKNLMLPSQGQVILSCQNLNISIASERFFYCGRYVNHKPLPQVKGPAKFTAVLVQFSAASCFVRILCEFMSPIHACFHLYKSFPSTSLKLQYVSMIRSLEKTRLVESVHKGRNQIFLPRNDLAF